LPGASDYQVRDLLPIVPTSVTTSASHYGRINAENESNLELLESVPNQVAAYRQQLTGKMPNRPSCASPKRHHDNTLQGLS
jgi:hypothetical protein